MLSAFTILAPMLHCYPCPAAALCSLVVTEFEYNYAGASLQRWRLCDC